MQFSPRELSLVDSPADEGFDRFTRMATKFLGVPVSLVSVVEEEEDRQFFTSACGLGEPWASRRQTPLSHSFCQHVKSSGTALCVEDARLHPLVKDNLAIPDLDVIAYLGMPIHAPDGSVLGALCAIVDEPRAWTDHDKSILSDLAASVTDQIGLRAALIESEINKQSNTYFGNIVENSQSEVFAFEPNTFKFINVNHGARENLGYRFDEMRDLTPVDIKPDYSEADFMKLIAPLKSGDASMLEFETRHLRKDGSTYPVSIRLEYFKVGTLKVFVAFCEDITERVTLERNLQENTENFSALFENTPDPIVISDIETTVLLANPAYETLLNCKRGELVGRRFIERLPAEYQDEILQSIANATPGNPTSTFMLSENLDGHQRVLMWKNIVHFADGRASKIFSIANDVSELHQAQKLAETNAAEAQKAFEVRKVFLANMSHEVRTPLNAIMGLFQLIQMADVPERQKKQAEVGLNASHHLLGQLVNVLEVSRMEAGAVEVAFESADVRLLAEQWEETAKATRHRLGKPIEISLDIEDRIPKHWVLDKRYVTQIVNNLTDNAIKFTEEGRVCIQLRLGIGEDQISPKHLDISVFDTGCGIPFDQREGIFQRFVQIDGAETRENGGSGLGLAISRELATLMGATLNVELPTTNDCCTTEFTLRLCSVPTLEVFEHAEKKQDTVG